MKKKENNRKNSILKKFIAIFFTIFFLFSNIYLIYGLTKYNSIETTLRILGSIALIDLTLILWLLVLKYKNYRRLKGFIIVCVISLIYCMIYDINILKINAIFVFY